MRSKVLMLMLCAISLPLFACLRTPSTSPDSLAEIFSQMEIDDELLLINRVEDGKDRMEAVDLSNKNAVRLHIIEIEGTEMTDRQFMFTPEWIYDTAGMHKHRNTYGLSSKQDAEALIEQHTTLYEAGRFTNEHLKELARSLQSPSNHRSGELHVLKGMDPSVTNPPSGTNAMMEIRYRENTLLEIHFKLEHDVPSTKQESNYISGTHWYFGSGLFSEFPDRQSFTEADD